MAIVITVLRRRKKKLAKHYVLKATQLVSDIAGFDSGREFSNVASGNCEDRMG